MDSELYDTLLDLILKKRTIKYKTASDYLDVVNKLMRDMNQTQFNFLKDTDNVYNYLKKHKTQGTQRRYIASIIVILDALYGDTRTVQEYRKIQCKLIEEYSKQLVKQEKNVKQSANWATLDTLKNVMFLYEKTLKQNNTFRKKKISEEEKQLMLNWLITALYVSDDENPPRRLDYRNMKIIHKLGYDNLSQPQLENNNFLVLDGNKKFFSFGDYKTSKKYGVQKIKVNKYLYKVIDKYIKYYFQSQIVGDSYLFHKALTPNKFSELVREAFKPTDKKIGVNMIRHIYVSEKHPAQNQARQQTALKMGHSLATNITYSLS
jgi:hypothetical protein